MDTVTEIEETHPVPEHLDQWTRNDRLYQTLLSFGLWVEPVFTDETRADIDYMRVSVGKPKGYEQDQG